MPRTIKATLVLGQRQQGWTESYFYEQSSGDLESEARRWYTLGQTRLLLCGRETYIKAIKTSIELDLNDNKVVGDSYLIYTPLLVASQGNPRSEDANTALQVIFRDNNGGKRKFTFMRGIYDTIVENGGVFNPAADGWATRFEDWKTKLIELRVGWLSTQREKDVTITTYSQVADSNQVKITVDEPTFGAAPYKPRYVRVRGLNHRNSTLNGSLLIKADSATTAKTVDAIAVIPFQSEGNLRTYSTVFQRADNIEGQKIVTRKVGSPLLESRGRSRVRART